MSERDVHGRRPGRRVLFLGWLCWFVGAWTILDGLVVLGSKVAADEQAQIRTVLIGTVIATGLPLVAVVLLRRVGRTVAPLALLAAAVFAAVPAGAITLDKLT